MRKRRRNGKQWEGYVRVSSVGKRQVLISPEIQRNAIERKAASMGVEIARWTEDLDTSGHGIERRACSRGAADAVDVFGHAQQVGRLARAGGGFDRRRKLAYLLNLFG